LRINGAFPVLIGLVAFAGCEQRQLEREAASRIRNGLNGGSAKVEVTFRLGLESLGGNLPSAKISASRFSTVGLPFHLNSDASQRGRIRRLHVDLKDFSLSGLHVQDLHATIPECRFDLRKALDGAIILSRAGSGPVKVILSAADIESFAQHKYPFLTRLQLDLTGPKVSASGTANLFGIPMSFQLSGDLVVENGSRFVLKNGRSSINGKPSADEGLLKAINPILDLDRDLALEGAVRLETVTVSGGLVIGTGSGTIPTKERLGDRS
jgi:hypothetical protein